MRRFGGLKGLFNNERNAVKLLVRGALNIGCSSWLIHMQLLLSSSSSAYSYHSNKQRRLRCHNC